MAAERFAKRMERRRRVRRKVRGSDERPRLSVYRSLHHIYAQVVSDESGQTLAAASTLSAELREALKSRRNVQAAKVVGKTIAERCLEQGNQPGGFRPQWLSLSWPGEGAGRRGARSGIEVLGTLAFRKREHRGTADRNARARHQGKGRPHQPGGQGRQGRPALQFQRAGGGWRSERPGRLRPGQGQRSARGDSQGRRTGQEEPDSGAAARRDDSARSSRAASARAR